MAHDDPGFDTIFGEAIEIRSAEGRAAFLARSCGEDEALRRRLERLIEAHFQAGSFLESPPAPPTDLIAPASPIEAPGKFVGPYKLLQQIGEGGMGVVYMAEQEQPVRRRVALKVIKPGMDTAQVVARFEAERQALALMDHPNIAKVLDAGATESGRPFFVMELVNGIPITEYCDQARLTPRGRLELFVPVCRAIQHAHQKGVIHRDIKPSNVMITLVDGRPTPRVIDFGVAKATGQRLTERSLFTQFGAIVGTLEYMSPEQAELSALDVDTRSDVFSLGVLLYELLTGSTPLERSRLREAGYAEILRRIREEEPPAPSTRLSGSGQALPSIAASRHTEPARLARLVRGELDWIAMRALEKDRTRRYDSAGSLAADVERYLADEAVEACPPSRRYRLGKFARKNRVALATAGAFAAILLAATAVSLGLAYWATRERDRAVAAEKLAKEQQDRAKEREQMAIDAVRRFGEVIRETPELKNNPALAPLRSRLLKEPQAFFKTLRDRLQADKETTPDSLHRLAHASFDLGSLSDEIGDKQDALRAYEESLAIRERMVMENPSVTEFQGELAESHHDIGDLLHQTGRPADALAAHERARAIFERLAAENPSVVAFQSNLAKSHHDIGDLLHQTGRPADALAAHERARAIFERLAAENPSVTSLQNFLAKSQNDIGMLLSNMGRPADALAAYERAHSFFEREAAENPSVTWLQGSLATSHNNIGNLLRATGRPADALASHERAIAIFERLAAKNPSVTWLQSSLATSHNNIGTLLNDTGRPADALAAHERAIAIFERLAAENPSVVAFQSQLASGHNNLGILLREMGRPADALASYGRARVIRERLAAEHPDSPDFASRMGGTLHNMATIDLDERRFEEARAGLKRAIEWQRKALASNPNHPTYRQFLTNHLGTLVLACEGLGRADEADQASRELAERAATDPAKATLDARLAAVLEGQAPKDDAERLRLADRAYEKARHASSVRLYVEALASKPKLRNDRQIQYAYKAACAAALAADGQAKDDPPPDDAARARLRRLALDWLEGELDAWAKALDTAPAEVKAKVATALQHWKVDSDLLGIRDEKGLAKLPEPERAAFQQLWLDVDRLLARALGGGGGQGQADPPPK